jgi:hypothetical protein
MRREGERRLASFGAVEVGSAYGRMWYGVEALKYSLRVSAARTEEYRM